MHVTTAIIGAALAAAAAEGVKVNERLIALQPNTWVRIHEQKKDDAVRFMRQAHGGSCFDAKRGRLILFGSNTHGRDWKNSPYAFDPVTLTWSQFYPQDDPKTYAVNEQGIPVAGEKGDHPWATHTFGCVVYDTKRDEMVVCCAPQHMVPGRFTNAVKHLWGKIRKHPTWTLDLKTKQWRALPCKPASFFPHSVSYDTDRHVIIGYSPGGVYELSGEPRTWKRVVKGGLFGWHDNSAYDAKHKALIVFGTNKNANDVVVYRVETREHRMMPTPGARPPKDQHTPMAFDPGVGKTVIVIDHVLERDDKGRPKKTVAETWLYDLGADAWAQIKTATLPFGCGMNYNMEYDPNHKVHLLVTGGYRGATTVWALKVK